MVPFFSINTKAFVKIRVTLGLTLLQLIAVIIINSNIYILCNQSNAVLCHLIKREREGGGGGVGWGWVAIRRRRFCIDSCLLLSVHVLLEWLEDNRILPLVGNKWTRRLNS